MKYKDAVSHTCKCGRELIVPFPSLQKREMTTPSDREVRDASYALTQEVIYHQNKACPWMYHERNKALASNGTEGH